MDRNGSAMTAPRPSNADTSNRRDAVQRLVWIVPIALIATTYPLFQVTNALFGDAVGGRLGWFVGMSVYWVVWGWIFSIWVLGRRRAWELIRPRRPSPAPIAHVGVVIALAAAVRFLIPGMDYEKASIGAAVLLVISSFANGVFEELFWRGVFLVAYPDNAWIRVTWASLMFGLWHLAPTSISAGGTQPGMVIGPVFMGLYLAWLSKKTGTIWWAVVAHTVGGLVMIS